MDHILRDCEGCCAAYLDNVVIYSDPWDDHFQHVHQLLSKISEAGLMLNVAKC